MPGADEPPVVAQCATPRTAIASAEDARDLLGGCRGHRLGRGQHAELRQPVRRRVTAGRPRSPRPSGSCPTASGSRPPVSIASPSRSTSVRRGALNVRSIACDPVVPGVDVDVLGLGGHVGPQLGPAPLGEELDPQRRPGRHRRRDGRTTTDDLARPVRRRPCEAAMERRLLAGPRAARPDDVARPCASTGASGDTHPHARAARPASATWYSGLTRLVDPGRAGLVVGRVGDRDPAERAEERQEVGLVEDRRDRLPPARLADQREVADRRAASKSSYRPASWRRRSSAVAAPGEPSTTRRSVPSSSSRAGWRLERRLARPPDRDRQVVDEQRRRRAPTGGGPVSPPAVR